MKMAVERGSLGRRLYWTLAGVRVDPRDAGTTSDRRSIDDIGGHWKAPPGLFVRADRYARGRRPAMLSLAALAGYPVHLAYDRQAAIMGN